MEWTTKTGSSQSYTFSLKADRDIGIGFIGTETGSISITGTNKSGSNINLTDTIKNNTANASLTIHTAAGSIIQKGDTALITGKADLQARNNIENINITSLGVRTANSDGKTYTTSDKVLLSAVSTDGGDIDVTVQGGTAEGQALPGNVEIQKLYSIGNETNGTGDVMLKADGNITQSGSDTAVKGREISLTSINGGIGTEKQAVVMDSHSEAYGFTPESSNVDAVAKKSIYLSEATGDMRIGSVMSQDGDVTLTAKNGRLLDALPREESGNNVDEDDLVRHWIDTGLIKGTPDYEGAYITGLKQDAANYKARAEAEYEEFVKGGAREPVKQRFTKADGSTYASAAEYLTQDATYQAIVKKYENPTYVWTKEQLLYSIRNAIVNKESGVTAETQGKMANVQGKNVTLVAKGIGMNSGTTTTILASDLTGGSEKAISNMKLLANADAADVTIKDKNGNILTFGTDSQGKQTVTARDANGNTVQTDGTVYSFVIGNLIPLGVKASGQVNVTASGGNVFVAGRGDENGVYSPLNTGVINAENQDVRLYTQEGIYNALQGKDAGQANVKAKNLIAYGGTKDIGAADKYLGVDLMGDLQSANANGSIYIKNIGSKSATLYVGSLYAGDTIALDSAAGIQMSWDKNYSGAYLNAGQHLRLTSDPNSGILGYANDPLRILNTGGEISLEAEHAYIKGVNGQLGDAATMNVGDVKTSGKAIMQSEGNLLLSGELSAGTDATLETLAGGGISVPGSMSAENATIQVDQDKTGKGKNGDMIVNGNVTARNLAALHNNTAQGDIYITGSVIGGSMEITSKNGVITGDGKLETTGKNLSITSETGDINIGGDFDVRQDLTLKTGGDGEITLYKDKKVHEVMNILAGRNISLQTENGLILVEGKIVSKSGSITAETETGEIFLAGVLDNTERNNVVNAGGDITATVKKNGDITYAGSVKAGGEVKATTQDGIIRYAGSVETGNRIIAEAENGFILYDGNVRAGGNVTALMRTGSIIYVDSVNANGNVEAKITQNGNIIYLGTVKADRNVIADTVAGDIIYGRDVVAGRSVISHTGSGTIAYMGKVTVGKDLPEQLRKGYGKIAYFNRYGLVGYEKAGSFVPVRNASPSEIKVTDVKH